MPKRTFWLLTGAALGAGSSLWAERKVRRSLQEATSRLQPDAIVVEVGRSARQVAGTAGERVRAAVTTGRSEMLRREEELWADLAAHGVDPESPVSVGTPSPTTPPALSGTSGRRPGRRSRRSTRVLTISVPDSAQ